MKKNGDDALLGKSQVSRFWRLASPFFSRNARYIHTRTQKDTNQNTHNNNERRRSSRHHHRGEQIANRNNVGSDERVRGSVGHRRREPPRLGDDERFGAREIQPGTRRELRGEERERASARERRFAEIGGRFVRAAVGIGRERTVRAFATRYDEISEEFAFAFAD